MKLGRAFKSGGQSQKRPSGVSRSA